MSRALALLACLTALPSLAGPFCLVTSTGAACVYSDIYACLNQARVARGACVRNREKKDRPVQTGRAPFCVVASYGRQCFYYEADVCRAAAAREGGACVVNQGKR